MRLYIVVRTDLESMNIGRIAAQAAHAGTKFVAYNLLGPKDALRDRVAEWLNEGGGFGTKDVRDGGSLGEIEELAENLNLPFDERISGWIVDPEYAVADGGCVHIVTDVPTAFYYFHQFADEDAPSELCRLPRLSQDYTDKLSIDSRFGMLGR